MPALHLPATPGPSLPRPAEVGVSMEDSGRSPHLAALLRVFFHLDFFWEESRYFYFLNKPCIFSLFRHHKMGGVIKIQKTSANYNFPVHNREDRF